LTNDVKDVNKESCSESKDLQVKDEEKVKVEDPAGVESPATESEATIVSEGKQEDEKIEPEEEEVKKEAEDDNASEPLAGDAIEQEETLEQEVDSSPAESKEEADSSATVEPAVEADVKELESQVEVADTPEPPKPSIEASAEDSEATLVQESESETAKEPAVPEVAAEEVNTTAEAAAEEVNTTPEAAAEEVITEELLQVSSVPETESKEAEPPIVSAITEPSSDAADDITTAGVSETAETSQGETISKLEENTESLKEEPLITDSNKLEEVSDNVPEAVVPESGELIAAEVPPVKELKVEEAGVTEEVPNIPDSAEGDKNPLATEESVSSDTNPVAQIVECFAAPEVKNEEEMQEKAVVSEEPTISDTTKTDAATQVTEVPSEGSGGDEKVEDKKEATAEGPVESLNDLDAAAEAPKVSSEGEKASVGVEEKKDESLGGEKTTLVETSRDIDFEEGKTNVNTEGDNVVSEKTEKDEKTPAESEKDAGEAPKAEVPAKSSHRQSNNIFSKVKQSIVKVKKAIVGKSPSSKTMSAEGKDELKVK